MPLHPSVSGLTTVRTSSRRASSWRLHGIAALGLTTFLVVGCAQTQTQDEPATLPTSSVGEAQQDSTPKPSSTPKPDSSTEQKTPFTSEPFDPDLLEADYPSDGHHDWIPLLDGYDVLLKDHQDVLDQDMDIVEKINKGSAKDPAQRERALDDQYDDMSITMGDGLGEKLGQIYMTGREN